MYGRLTFFEGTKGKEEAATRAFREQVVPLATRQPGFAGVELMLDREEGRGIAASYSADAASLEASQAEAAKLLNAIGMRIGFTVTGLIEGEIPVVDHAAPPREGTWARLRIAKGQGASLKASVALVGERMVPLVRQQRGYRATFGLINHSTGDGIAVSVWDTREDLEAAGAAMAGLRREAAVKAPMAEEHSEAYEIAVSEMPTIATT